MNPKNIEAVEILARSDLKNYKKIGELAAKLDSQETEDLNLRFDIMVKKIRDFSVRVEADAASEAEIGDSPGTALGQYNFETFERPILCADGVQRQVKLFAYDPRESYSPSLTATWTWTDEQGGAHIYREYIARKMLSPGSPAYDPAAGGVLALAEQSLEAYAERPGINSMPTDLSRL